MSLFDFREQIPGYERYLVRFQGSIDDPEHLEKIAKAYKLAKNAHRGQYRGDGVTFYFQHCRGVADMVSCELAIKHDWRINALALIHDVMEDAEGLSYEDVEKEFDAVLARWLRLVSKDEEYQRDKSSFVRRLIQSGEIEPIIVKLSDRVMNLRTLGMVPKPDFQIKQVKETIAEYYALADILTRLLADSLKWQRYRYVGHHLKMALQTQTTSFAHEYGSDIIPHS